MSEKMLVTQALDERDLLVKKINDKIEKASFVDTVRVNEERVYEKHITREEFAKKANASWQQIQDLINRFQKIDAALVASNAATRIMTSYGSFTVAGAISLRGRMRGTGSYEERADFEERLRLKMKTEYEVHIQQSELKNRQLQTTTENMRMSILGKDSKGKEEKPLEVVDAYVKENTTEVVDPLDVQKKMEELKEKMEELKEKRMSLLTELDTQIKVSNATTFIEID